MGENKGDPAHIMNNPGRRLGRKNRSFFNRCTLDSTHSPKSARSALVRTMLGTGIARTISTATSFFSVPILLTGMGVHTFGIWVTLTSLIAWVALLDLGVGMSLKNTVARSRATESREEASTEFLGSFRFTGGLSILLLALFFVALVRIDLLRQDTVASALLYASLLVMLPFSLGNNVLQGFGKVGLQAFLTALPGIAFVLTIYAANATHIQLQLRIVAGLYASLYVIGTLITAFIGIRLLGLRFSALWGIAIYRLPHSRIRVGAGFFALQIASIIMYSLGTYLAYRLFGAESAARYNVLNRLFLVGLGFYSIIISVLWPEIVRSIAQGAFLRIRRIFNLLIVVAMLFSCAALLGAVFTPRFVNYWTSGRIAVSSSEAVFFALLVSVQALAYSGAVFLNAFEQLRGQIAVALLGALAFLPLTLMFVRLELGIVAIPLAAASATGLSAILCILWARRLIGRKYRAHAGGAIESGSARFLDLDAKEVQGVFPVDP